MSKTTLTQEINKEQERQQLGKVKSFMPVNTKSLLAFVFGQMEKLDNDEISPNKAMAQAKLASQCTQILNYELKRTVVQLQLERSGHEIENGSPRIRQIESKAFDG